MDNEFVMDNEQCGSEVCNGQQVSAILLEKNGTWPSSKQTKHLNCQYYFITNSISAGDLSIEYCPTGEMVRLSVGWHYFA
jgi:hypothetical protein